VGDTCGLVEKFTTLIEPAILLSMG
jgi:hypothetical protein